MISLFKVFSDEAHNMRSGSEIDDGTDKKASDSQRGN
jgi:hypothetical protein